MGDAIDAVATLEGPWVLWLLLPLGGLAAAITGLVRGRGRDVERKQHDDDGSAFADAERLLAMTAHEMRGPLTAIVGAINTLRARDDRLTQVERAMLLTMATRQAGHLELLIDDLMVTAQLRSNNVILRTEWTDLEAVVERALESAASKRHHHHLEVFVDPLRCKIDASRTTQILRNLIENAYKYTPEGSTVWISAKVADGELLLEVADNGAGIPADQHHDLFEPFGRVDHAGNPNEGIGIGLYVVRELVEAMGGTIDLAASSEGTTFTMTIPCEVTSDQQPPFNMVERINRHAQDVLAEELSG